MCWLLSTRIPKHFDKVGNCKIRDKRETVEQSKWLKATRGNQGKLFRVRVRIRETNRQVIHIKSVRWFWDSERSEYSPDEEAQLAEWGKTRDR